MTALRGRSTRLARRHPTAAFFVLTYAISWGLWLPVVLGVDGPLRRALFVAGIFGPAVAGVLTTWLAGESVGGWLRAAFLTRVPARWWAVAVAVPVALTLAASAAYALAGGAVDLGLLPARFAAYAPALAVAAVVGGGQEELGWRGFALPRLEARFGPVGGTLVLGAVWALWHLPAIAATADLQHGLGARALMPVLGLTALSVVGYAFVLTWVFNRTGSVLVAALLHGGFNTASGALVPLPAGAVEGAAYQGLSVAMTLALVAAIAVLLVTTRGRLGLRAPGLRVAGSAAAVSSAAAVRFSRTPSAEAADD